MSTNNTNNESETNTTPFFVSEIQPNTNANSRPFFYKKTYHPVSARHNLISRISNSCVKSIIKGHKNVNNYSKTKPPKTTFPIPSSSRNIAFDSPDFVSNMVDDYNNGKPIIDESIANSMINDLHNICKIRSKPIMSMGIGFDMDNSNNVVKKEVVSLNFEDDTFRLVYKISDDKTNIIKNWYNQCNIMFDVEDINIDIPNECNDNDLTNILNKNIDYNNKELFINEYVPTKLEVIKKQHELLDLETELKMNVTHNLETHITQNNQTSMVKSLYELNIKVQDNLVYYDNYFYYSCENNQIITLTKYKKRGANDNYDWIPMKPEESLESHVNTMICQLPKDTIESNVKAYNEEYDCLYPTFGSNAGVIHADTMEPQEQNSLNSFNLYIILFNPQFLHTMIIQNPDLETIETIFENTEYGFMELFTYKVKKDDVETVGMLYKLYDNITHNNVDELNNTLTGISQFLTYINTKQTTNNAINEEEKCVKQYLDDNYVLSDDINHKMKASAIYDVVVNMEICKVDKTKISTFKNRLSTYLKDLGLKKKRYNDGFYYYGIQTKLDKIYENDTQTKYERILENRKNEDIQQNNIYNSKFL